MQGQFAPDRGALHQLLQRYNDHPEERAGIVTEVERRFERPMAILVIDTCGFSRSVRATGIVAFLALLQRLTEIVRPSVEGCAGCVLRTEADNVFVTLADPTAALRCAQTILCDVERTNARLPDNERIYLSMGIGFGELLVIDDETVYGDEMNLASKLGEDLAKETEILLTPAAHAAIAAAPGQFEPVRFSVSGMSLTAYRCA